MWASISVHAVSAQGVPLPNTKTLHTTPEPRPQAAWPGRSCRLPQRTPHSLTCLSIPRPQGEVRVMWLKTPVCPLTAPWSGARRGCTESSAQSLTRLKSAPARVGSHLSSGASSKFTRCWQESGLCPWPPSLNTLPGTSSTPAGVTLCSLLKAPRLAQAHLG